MNTKLRILDDSAIHPSKKSKKIASTNRETSDLTEFQKRSISHWSADKEKIKEITEDATKKHHEETDQIAKASVSKFLSGVIDVHRTNKRRIFNPLTSLKREARQYLTHKGEHLIEIDASSSQPLILIDYLVANGYPVEQELINAVGDGMFYELFSGERNDTKVAVFKFFFSKELNENRIYQELEHRFPMFLDSFKKIQGKKSIAELLQKLESEIWIDKISKRLMQSGIEHATIHDSVVFSGVENINKVLDVIDGAFTMKKSLHIHYLDANETPIVFERTEEAIEVANGAFRVGDGYYRQINVLGKEKLIGVSRQTIIDDYGKDVLKEVPKFETFCNRPDNKGDFETPANLFNTYVPFKHIASSGEWNNTKNLLLQVFGDQYEYGLDYLQLLYEKPMQTLPILCLVSEARQTGKTTFINWLSDVFTGNTATVGNEDLKSGFNAHWADKLLLMVDESKIDSGHTMERLKSISTAKTIQVNQKMQRVHQVDYYGKIILLSNHADNFIYLDKEEIRFWIRELETLSNVADNIADKIKKEIPSFIHFLDNREMTTSSQSRMWFLPDQLHTDARDKVLANSKRPIIKIMIEYINDWFNENESDYFFARPRDFRDTFDELKKFSVAEIKRAILKDFQAEQMGKSRYRSEECISGFELSNHAPFKFYRHNFE